MRTVTLSVIRIINSALSLLGIILILVAIVDMRYSFLLSHRISALLFVLGGLTLFVKITDNGPHEEKVNATIVKKKKARLKLVSSNGKKVDSETPTLEVDPEDYYVKLNYEVPGDVWEEVKKLAKSRNLDELQTWKLITKNGMAVMIASDNGKDVIVDGKQYFP